MNIKQVFKNNQNWISEKLKLNPHYFRDLAKGQRPIALYIGCSDSRVTAEELMGAAPGDIFVHRNIGNMVSGTDLSAMSTINYAVWHLKVAHIVVCGHYNCGAVEAAMQPADLGILNPWLRNIRDVYRLHKEELDSIESTAAKSNRLVELNVQEQCVNVIKTPEVQKALREKKLTVHGWVVNLNNGVLFDLKIDFDKILNDIMEIYRLS